MRALLDLNVLIALMDEQHLHHELATQWLSEHLKDGWASCPLTQNGCIRVMSQVGYPNSQNAALVARHLSSAANEAAHQFWPDDVSLLADGLIDWSRIVGSKQVTDVYLLALAHHHGGRFVTFDQHIPTKALKHLSARSLLVLT